MLAGPNKYVVYNHQGKGQAYIRALSQHSNFTQLPEGYYLKLSFVLTDSDILGRQPKLQKLQNWGAGAVFVIPHTARPNLVNDVAAGFDGTTAQFVVTSSHAEVMRLYGYDKPIHPVGWTLCPIRKYQPTKGYRVLFGPIHPRCSEIDKKVNRDTFKRLEKLARSGDIHLTVRFIRSLPDSGLEKVEHPNIEYTVGNMDQSYEAIDKADVVVGHQTFGWLGVARGRPTLMMAEHMPTHIEPRNGAVQYARNWDKYKDLVMYPLDILATHDTLGLIQRACRDDSEIMDWRRRMIGYPFRPKRFVEVVKSYL